MRKNQRLAALTLSKDTLRNLSMGQARRVAGGDTDWMNTCPGNCSCGDCATCEDTCLDTCPNTTCESAVECGPGASLYPSDCITGCPTCPC
jgi:hypothetical protein